MPTYLIGLLADRFSVHEFGQYTYMKSMDETQMKVYDNLNKKFD
jgi:hypothetical protein